MAKSDDVWFTIAFIGCNQLRLIVYNLTFNFLSVKEKVMSNKLGEGLELLAWNNISCQESMAWKGH
jgi:hypothetical protein